MAAPTPLLSEQKAKPKRILNLSGCQLEQLPEKVTKYTYWKIMILDNNRLTSVPVQLHMRTMKLGYNKFGDNVPPAIVEALSASVKLRTLDLSSNKLKNFPGQLNNNRDLENVNLFDNKLSQIAITSTKFRNIDLGHNEFTAPPPIPPNITALGYSYNILESLESNFPNIQNIVSLTLNQCNLKSISESLSCPNLKSIELNMNNLSTIPDLSRFAPQLERIDLSSNLLKSFPNFPSSIKEINLSRNELTEIPQTFRSLTELAKFNISHNQLKSFPAIGSGIIYIDASHNEIETVESFDAPQLELINFSSNKLTQIPSFRTVALKHYLLGDNNITSINVDNLSPQAQLLSLYNNEISSIPNSIYSLPIVNFNIYGNRLESLPFDLEGWKTLSVFNCSNNPINSITTLPTHLTQLFAGYCNLTSLPDSLADNQDLVVVCVPGNNISYLPQLSNVRILNASRNKISYFPDVPQTIETLDLSYNNLSAFPDIFVYPQLVEFDVGHNDIMNARGFSKTRLKVLQLNDNPIRNQVSIIGYSPTLSTLNITNTEISLPEQPQVSEVLSNVNPNKWYNIRVVRTDTYCAFAQMKGNHENMEDSIVCHTNVRDQIDLVGIFDGHSGSLTSMYSSKQFAMLYETQPVPLSIEGLTKVLQRLVVTIHDNKLTDGATCGLAVIAGQQALVTTIGDVRVIVVKKDGTLKMATQDHHPYERAEFERIKEHGGFVQNGHTYGVISASRAVGDFNIPGITPTADIQLVDFDDSDKYLIVASDGVFNVLSNEQVCEIAKNSSTAAEAAYDIRNVAYTNYSSDNISVVVVDLDLRIHSLYQRLVHSAV